MKIAIIGYGRMGKMIEETARERNHEIGLIIDIQNINELTPDNITGHDVAIEFTMPNAAFRNISSCFDAKIPVVSGTTGWMDQFDDIIKRCESEKQTFFYASNFSLGVNILFKINRDLAMIMNQFNQYNISIKEIHHTKKMDAPSGTAITLANDIISFTDRKTKWEMGHNPDNKILPVEAIRADNIPGIHEVTYESDFDSLTLKHSAKGRKGFALGAMMAAEYIQGKTGYYTMQDLLTF